MSLIETHGLSVAHGSAPVLSGVDFHIDRAEIVTVVGPNGSGKSTLVKALLGILPPAAGTMRRAPGLRIGYVPQKIALDPAIPMTVRRFLSLPTRVDDAHAESALERVGVPGLGARQLSQLSGGQLQRVLLSRAMMTHPDLLILDEPTQGLDQPGTAAFYALIEDIRRRTGAAILLVSHDLHVVMSASDRVICLNGHVCCQGTPHVVRAAPEYQALFGHGTQGTMALYQHDHDHDHDHDHADHVHGDQDHGDHGRAG